MVFKVYVATLDPRAYQQIATSLKTAGFRFESIFPWENVMLKDSVILTSKKDYMSVENERVLLIENTDGDPLIFKCQVYSKMYKRIKEVTLGIDPGKRIGLSVKMNERYVGSTQFFSKEELMTFLNKFFSIFPGQTKIKVGNGDVVLANEIAMSFGRNIRLEVVDESGTSKQNSYLRLSKDQAAATSILYRKGVSLTSKISKDL